jgi:hypothetical protein
MTRKEFLTVLAFFALGLLYPAHLYAAECTIDSSAIDRGEKKVFILGGEDIPSNYTLGGLSEASITTNCEQWLDWYGWTEEQQIPGLYLILEAENDATTASMSILDGGTGDPVCEPLTISVPDRTRVAEASLAELKYVDAPFLILEIKGDESQDLSQACEEGLSFPESRWWPSLSLLSQQEVDEIPLVQRLALRVQLLSPMEVDQPLICTESSIVALVKAVGQQRYPAKIVISKVRLGLQEGKKKKG